jgi:capsular polysaccharide transport system permease protein
MDTIPVLPGPAKPRFQRLRVIFALVVREMGTRFGRSAGGYIWAIAEPLGGILLLAIVFNVALRSPPLGQSFMMFYATGMVPFYVFNSMWRGVGTAVSSNRGLLTYPVVTALDAVLSKALLNLVTAAIIAVGLYVGIILASGVHVTLDLAAITLAFVLAALLGLGVGTMNCVLSGFFPTWDNIWAILTRPLFIVSGIFFTFESIPKALQAILWYNPLVHVIGVMRSGFYGSYAPYYVSYSYVLGIALGLFVVGGYLLRRHESFLIER